MLRCVRVHVPGHVVYRMLGIDHVFCSHSGSNLRDRGRVLSAQMCDFWTLKCVLCEREVDVKTWKLPRGWRWQLHEEEFKPVCRTCVWRLWRDAQREAQHIGQWDLWLVTNFRRCDIQLAEYVQGFRRKMQQQQQQLQDFSGGVNATAIMAALDDAFVSEDMVLD